MIQWEPDNCWIGIRLLDSIYIVQWILAIGQCAQINLLNQWFKLSYKTFCDVTCNDLKDVTSYVW